MAQNKIESTGFTGEHLPAANAPTWTAPSESVPHSEKSVLLTNNDKDVPNYNAFPAPSAPVLDDLPPNYFDISIVPNNVVLHYNEVVPYTEASKAVIERKKEGVLSFDPLIDRNPDQLWLYFMTYLNEKPSSSINIHGYYVEHYIDFERYQASDGSWHTRPVPRTRDVTDFNFSLDLAHYVSQQWWRVAVMPSKKTIKAGETVSLRDAIEQYTRSERDIKEIICQKQLVGWNFQELSDKIKTIIYSTGYRNHIRVTFPVNNNRIEARSSSKLSRFSSSTLVRVLCVISCLFLIFGPIYLCLRAKGSTKDKIVADYSMVAPVDTFLHFNAGIIANAAIGRSRELYKINLFIPWTQRIRQSLINIYADEQPQFQQNSSEHLLMPFMDSRRTNLNLKTFSLPRYFCWIVPFFLLIISTPRHERDIDALASAHIGIRHILTLTEEEPLPEE